MARLFHDPAPSRLRHVELAYVTEPEAPQIARPEPAKAAPAATALSIEDDLIQTILAPLPINEPAAIGFSRKEAVLVALLGSLTVDEAVALHARLSAAAEDDALVVAFGRLSMERRGRLLAYLQAPKIRTAASMTRPSFP
jgi:hypothetical protein